MEANKVPQNELGVSEVVNLTPEKRSDPPCATPQAGQPSNDNVTKVMRLMAEVEARDSFRVAARCTRVTHPACRAKPVAASPAAGCGPAWDSRARARSPRDCCC